MSNVIVNDIKKEFNDDFLRYSMAVITDRALPDVKDGLKPVHRRIIYGMVDGLKLKSNKATVKSARIVGDIMGKLHPHGDSSIYDAACRLTLDYTMRYPLIIGQGSFGSTDGDGAAAMRYTEMKPSKLMELIMDGTKKNAVDMKPNFAEDLEEPVVLPALFPNLLCNPTSGIAVGMACNFAPHNLTEVCDGIIAYIDNNDITVEELMNYIKGPDFPLGGVITNTRDLLNAYETGRSKNTLRIRSDYKLEENKLVFTSIPFGTERSKIREQLGKCVGQLDGLVKDYNDESNKNGIRITFDLEKEEYLDDVLRILFKETNLETTFSINQTCLVDGSPKELSLKEIISYYVEHQMDVIKRTTKFDLDKIQEKKHTLEGLVIALEDIDNVIALIKSSMNKGEAREKLINKYSLTELQANAVLGMTLSRLTNLEIEDIKKQLEEILKLVKRYKEILASEEVQKQVLINKIKDMKNNFGDKRRTKLDDIVIPKAVRKKVEVPSTPVKVTLSANDTIKLTKGISKIGKTVSTKLNSSLVVFVDDGTAYKIAVAKITETAQNLKVLLDIAPTNKILDICSIEEDNIVNITTSFGMIKKAKTSEYSSSRNVMMLKLKEGDKIINVKVGDFKYLYQRTSDDYVLTFDIGSIPTTGRMGIGLKGIKLHDSANVIEAVFSDELGKDNIEGKRVSIGKKLKK